MPRNLGSTNTLSRFYPGAVNDGTWQIFLKSSSDEVAAISPNQVYVIVECKTVRADQQHSVATACYPGQFFPKPLVFFDSRRFGRAWPHTDARAV